MKRLCKLSEFATIQLNLLLSSLNISQCGLYSTSVNNISKKKINLIDDLYNRCLVKIDQC